MKDPVLQALEDVRNLISDERCWLRGSFTNNSGDAFCLVGAVRKVCGGEVNLYAEWISAPHDSDKYYLAYQVNKRLMRAAGIDGVLTQWNDSQTHARVLEVVDKAMEGLA